MRIYLFPVLLALITLPLALRAAPSEMLRIERPEAVFPAPPRHRLYLRGITGSEQLLFSTEGRSIVSAEALDLDGDGSSELCLLLDGGGSGGLRDLVVLDERDGRWQTVAEREGLAGASIEAVTVEGRKGKGLRLRYFLRDFDSGGSCETTTRFVWDGARLRSLGSTPASPKEAPDFLALVMSELERGKPDRAARYALRALGKARSPELRARCLLLAARARILEGRVPEARALLERAVKPAGGGTYQVEAAALSALLGPEDRQRDRLLVQRARALRALGRKSWAKALRLADAVAAGAGDDALRAEALWLEAEAHRGAGRDKKALALYRRIVLDHPDSSLHSLAEEAVVALEMGRFVPRRGN